MSEERKTDNSGSGIMPIIICAALILISFVPMIFLSGKVRNVILAIDTIPFMILLTLVVDIVVQKFEGHIKNDIFNSIALSRSCTWLFAITAFVEAVLLSQFFTEKIVTYLNDYIVKYYSLDVIWKISITFPKYGGKAFWIVLAISSVLLIYVLHDIFECERIGVIMRAIPILLFVSILEIIVVIIYLLWAVSLLNAFLPLGIIALFGGGFAAVAGSSQTNANVTKPKEMTGEESKVKVWKENGMGKECLKVSSDGKRYFDDGEWKSVDHLKDQ